MTQQKWDSADLIFNIHHKEEKSAACKMSCRAAHRYIVVQSREWKVQSARLEWCSHSKWNGAVSQTGKCGQATGTVQSDMWNLQVVQGKKFPVVSCLLFVESNYRPINTK